MVGLSHADLALVDDLDVSYGLVVDVAHEVLELLGRAQVEVELESNELDEEHVRMGVRVAGACGGCVGSDLVVALIVLVVGVHVAESAQF